jgi:hypothetical protein
MMDKAATIGQGRSKAHLFLKISVQVTQEWLYEMEL